MKLKAKSCAEDKFHLIFNNVLTSSPDLLQSNTHKGCCVLNTTDYNYKLRSMIGREDDFTTNKRTWFDVPVRATFLWSWMISLVLGDYTDMRGITGYILGDVPAPHVSMNDSIGS